MLIATQSGWVSDNTTRWHTFSPDAPPEPPAPPVLEDFINTESAEPLYFQIQRELLDPALTDVDRTFLSSALSRFSMMHRLMERARYELWDPLSVLRAQYRSYYPTGAYPTPRLLMARLMTYDDIEGEIQYLISYAQEGDLTSAMAFFNPETKSNTILGPDCFGYDGWASHHAEGGTEYVSYKGGNSYGPVATISTLSPFRGKGLDPVHHYGLTSTRGPYEGGRTRVTHACCGESLNRTAGCWIMLANDQVWGAPVPYTMLTTFDPWVGLAEGSMNREQLKNGISRDIRTGTAFRDVNYYATLDRRIRGNLERVAEPLATTFIDYAAAVREASYNGDPKPMDPYSLFLGSNSKLGATVKSVISDVFDFNEVHCVTGETLPIGEREWAAYINTHVFKVHDMTQRITEDTWNLLDFDGSDIMLLQPKVKTLAQLDRVFDALSMLLETRDNDNSKGVLSTIMYAISELRNTMEVALQQIDIVHRRIFPARAQWSDDITEITKGILDKRELRFVNSVLKDTYAEFVVKETNFNDRVESIQREINRMIHAYHKRFSSVDQDDDEDDISKNLDTLFGTLDALQIFKMSDIPLVEKVVAKAYVYQQAVAGDILLPGAPQGEPPLTTLPAVPMINADDITQLIMQWNRRKDGNRTTMAIVEKLATEVTETDPTQELADADALLTKAEQLQELMDTGLRDAAELLKEAQMTVADGRAQQLLRVGKLLRDTIVPLTQNAYMDAGPSKWNAYDDALGVILKTGKSMVPENYMEQMSLLVNAIRKTAEEVDRAVRVSKETFIKNALAVGKSCSEVAVSALALLEEDEPLDKIFTKELIKLCMMEIRGITQLAFPAYLMNENITNKVISDALDQWNYQWPDSDLLTDILPYDREFRILWFKDVHAPISSLIAALSLEDNNTVTQLQLVNVTDPQNRVRVLLELGRLRKAAKDRSAAAKKRTPVIFSIEEDTVTIPPLVDIPQSGDIFTKANFKNTRNTCPMDVVLTLMFKIPRTWFEMEIVRKTRSIRLHGEDCTIDDAIAVQEYLLNDIKQIQGQGDDANECLSAEAFLKCVKTPITYQNGQRPNALFKYSHPDVMYDNVRDLFIIDDSKNHVPEIIVLPTAWRDRIAFSVLPTMVPDGARLVSFAAGDTTTAQLSELKDIVSFTANNIGYTLAGVILSRTQHFITAMRDPRTLKWWLYDALSTATIDPQQPPASHYEKGIFKGIRDPVTIRVQTSVPGSEEEVIVNDVEHVPIFWLYMREEDLAKAVGKGKEEEEEEEEDDVPLTPDTDKSTAFPLSPLGYSVLLQSDTSTAKYTIGANMQKNVTAYVDGVAKKSYTDTFPQSIGFHRNNGWFIMPDHMRSTDEKRRRALIYVWDQLVAGAKLQFSDIILRRRAREIGSNIRMALIVADIALPPPPPPAPEPVVEEPKVVTPQEEEEEEEEEPILNTTSTETGLFPLSPQGLKVLNEELSSYSIENAAQRGKTRAYTPFYELNTTSIGLAAAAEGSVVFVLPQSMSNAEEKRRRALIYAWEQFITQGPEAPNNIRIALMVAGI
jgi:hypothetical protein